MLLPLKIIYIFNPILIILVFFKLSIDGISFKEPLLDIL